VPFEVAQGSNYMPKPTKTVWEERGLNSGSFLVDSGAQASLCARRFVPEFVEIQPTPNELNWIGVTSLPLKLFGIATLPLRLSDDLEIEQDCIVLYAMTIY